LAKLLIGLYNEEYHYYYMKDKKDLCQWCHYKLPKSRENNPLLGSLLAVKTLCLGQSWWFSPCHILLLGPSLHGPTSISLLWLYKGYICVPHLCWVVAPITWNFIVCENLCLGW
jgi:hypothetical protein